MAEQLWTEKFKRELWWRWPHAQALGDDVWGKVPDGAVLIEGREQAIERAAAEAANLEATKTLPLDHDGGIDWDELAALMLAAAEGRE